MKICGVLIFIIFFIPLTAVHNFTVNSGDDITVAYDDSLHFEFEFENVGNTAEYVFAVEVLGEQIPLFDGNDELFTDGGLLDNTGIDGLFSGGINNFMQLPSNAALVITLTDEAVSDEVSIHFDQLNTNFSVSGSVLQESSWIDLPVIGAFVYCAYNCTAQIIIDLLENFTPQQFLEFTESGHYLLSDITGFLGDYQIYIPDEIDNVDCALGVYSMLDDNQDFVPPNPVEVVINGHLSNIEFLYYQTEGNFYGLVMNSEGLPVSGADFVLEVPGSPVPRYFSTDGDGNFTIPLLNNTYPYNIAASGYLPYDGLVTIAGSDVYQEISLTEAENPLITVSRQLLPGREWISINVTDDDMSPDNVLASLGENAHAIKSQMQSAIYYSGMGWYGSLSNFSNFELYQITMEQPAMWEFSGLPLDPQTTDYELWHGWNYISFAPQAPEEINFALAGLGDNGITIRSQTEFADYFPGIGWQGTLTTLEPLHGYKLQMQNATSFTYPLPLENYLPDSQPDWLCEFDYRAFDYNGTMVLATEDNFLPGKIYAICNNEIRGCSETLILSDVFGRNFYSIMVYGNQSSNDKYTLFYQYPDTKAMFELDYSFTFQPDMKAGNFLFPIMITLPYEEHNELPEIHSELTIFPNPFNPEATISFNLPTQSEVKLAIYNLKGQLVETLINSNMQPGTHTTTWAPQSTSSGIYLLKLQHDKNQEVRKLILLK
jgi:Secretion system C-terminal sorting domain